MIWCVRFADVERHLAEIGFERIAETAETLFYERGEESFSIRKPNVFGQLPETIVNAAFNASGLTPPDLERGWCD